MHFWRNTHILLKCFMKKENYDIEDNGRIVIKYKILLESSTLSKEVALHLVPA